MKIDNNSSKSCNDRFVKTKSSKVLSYWLDIKVESELTRNEIISVFWNQFFIFFDF